MHWQYRVFILKTDYAGGSPLTSPPLHSFCRSFPHLPTTLNYLGFTAWVFTGGTSLCPRRVLPPHIYSLPSWQSKRIPTLMKEPAKHCTSTEQGVCFAGHFPPCADRQLCRTQPCPGTCPRNACREMAEGPFGPSVLELPCQGWFLCRELNEPAPHLAVEHFQRPHCVSSGFQHFQRPVSARLHRDHKDRWTCRQPARPVEFRRGEAELSEGAPHPFPLSLPTSCFMQEGTGSVSRTPISADPFLDTCCDCCQKDWNTSLSLSLFFLGGDVLLSSESLCSPEPRGKRLPLGAGKLACVRVRVPTIWTVQEGPGRNKGNNHFT